MESDKKHWRIFWTLLSGKRRTPDLWNRHRFGPGKNLIKLHEGDIQVKSLPDIGTTFYLRLLAENTYPQALHGEDIHTEKQDAKAEDSTMKLEAIEPDKNARPIILVVEDNADIRDYIADSFTDLYEVKTAANGKKDYK